MAKNSCIIRPRVPNEIKTNPPSHITLKGTATLIANIPVIKNNKHKNACIICIPSIFKTSKLILVSLFKEADFDPRQTGLFFYVFDGGVY